MIRNNLYSIGLIDFDTTYTRKYWVPNYDLCIIYAYFRNRKDKCVRKSYRHSGQVYASEI